MNAQVCGESNRPISPHANRNKFPIGYIHFLNLPDLKLDRFKVVCFLQDDGLNLFILLLPLNQNETLPLLP